MKKEDREKVFKKYGGRCAYCGCELVKGWHVDHLEPVKRKKKFVKGNYWADKKTGERVKLFLVTEDNQHEYVWIEDKWVDDGFERPENNVIENFNPACASCNIQKHSQSLESFRDNIKQFVNSLNLYRNQYKFAKRYNLIKETNEPVVFYFETLE